MQLSWREVYSPSQPLRAKYTTKVRDIIAEQYKAVAEAVKTKGISEAMTMAASITLDERVFSVVSDIHTTVGVFYARRQYIALSRSITYRAPKKAFRMVVKSRISNFESLWRQGISNMLAGHNIRFVDGITESTRESIIKTLQTAIANGWSEERTIDALTNMQVPFVRAQRIVRTETTRAINVGLLLAAASVPFELKKQWITSDDERVRGNPLGLYPSAAFSHYLLHDSAVGLEENFFNGEAIGFPCDPKASASNTINCRCVLGFTPVLDRQGRPIPKRTPTNIIIGL